MPLVFSRSGSRSRKHSSRAGTASRASEQGCVRLLDSIKMRDLYETKVAGLSVRVAMPYLVSLSALARYPTALLLIIPDPALAVVLRTALTRQG